MPRVVVAGDANVDIVVQFPRFIDTERREVAWPSPQVFGGGTSSNTAAALGRLGVKCDFVGTVGDDPNGRFAADDLEASGVDVSGLARDASLNTVGVFAFVDEAGERYLWGWPRENQSFKVIDQKKVDFDRLRSADWFHSSGMSLVYDTSARSTIAKMYREAHFAGVPTSLDLNLRVDDGALDPDFESALREILPDVDFVLGSGPDEYSYLGEGGWRENAERLASDGRVVVVRDGANGSLAVCDGKSIEAPAFRVNVVDTVGAGDVFNAGFIYSLVFGGSLKDALVFGNAAAGYSVGRAGARNTPTAEELRKFIGSHRLD